MADRKDDAWPSAPRARGLLWRDGLTIVYAPDGTTFSKTGWLRRDERAVASEQAPGTDAPGDARCDR